MKIQCAACHADLNRPPSRIAANALQFCDMRCVGAYRARPVEVACAVCDKRWTVKASRATQNQAITCSPACIATLRQRNIIAKWNSGERRQTTCDYCGQTIIRKPSQLEKYAANYCNRSCKKAGQSGPHPEQITGRWYPCETCGEDVWRTPATLEAHVFCSRKCAGRAGQERGRRTDHPQIACGVCGQMFEVIPARGAKAKYCSQTCRVAASKAALRRRAAALKGTAAPPWSDEQRAKLSATLRRKYQAEWTEKGVQHSVRMTGESNPQWQDGRSLEPYTPGFTRTVKRLIAERDRRECQICGKPRTRGNTHAVHHIDGAKANHAPENLVLLCHSCHQSLHQGRLTLPEA